MTNKYVLYIRLLDESLREQYIESIKKYFDPDCLDSGFDLIIPEDFKYRYNNNMLSLVKKTNEFVSNPKEWGSEHNNNMTNLRIDHKIQCMVLNCKINKLTGYYLYPRSSIAKTSFIMSNSTGIIDAGYRGNIIAAIKRIDEDSLYIIEKFQHNKLFQLCTPNLSKFKSIELVNTLPTSKRGVGGFGSTDLV